MTFVSDPVRARRPNILLSHMYATYLWLRIGLGALALILPPLLWIGSDNLEASMSAYYWVDGMRDWFVGILWAAAAGLIAYKGFSWKEDLALNLAGLFAISVAMVPTDPPGSPAAGSLSAHGTFAILFFLCLAYVAIRRAPDTLDGYNSEKERKAYLSIYRIVGGLMVVLPLVAFWLSSARKSGQAIFYVEFAAIYMFAAYWITKSVEMWKRTRRARARLRGMTILAHLDAPKGAAPELDLVGPGGMAPLAGIGMDMKELL